MNLIINNHIIDYNLQSILVAIQEKTNGRYLNTIKRQGDNIAITCPFHKDGQERHPSCYVYNKIDNSEVPFGFFRCFTCGTQGQLYELVAHCFNCGIEEAKEWLVNNFSKTLTESSLDLPIIDLKKETKQYLDESILNQYAYFHPYMFKRKLTEDVIRKFKIGWNKELDTITFPIWDENNNLLGITERNVKNKYFHIPENIGKPVYLLNYIKKENITEVYVVESQIDALYLWSLGYPAIALLGTGTKKQYEILKKSGIRIFHLALDGDLAGRHGNMRFIEYMPYNTLIDILLLPNGKDINDLSKEEIEHLNRVDKNNYLQNNMFCI
ncbi:MAG: toprim domain-containing protein [Romboutsia sp.]|nr:toprim domain-containing protein [Romboutsia sp.]